MDALNESLSARYATGIDLWQMAHGCTGHDMTPNQWERFRALEAAAWSVAVAVRLLNTRHATRGGRSRD